jgi:hypothetical protein
MPALVLLGWMADKPLSLDFHLFETATIFMAVITVSILIQKGKSNWLSGLMLLVSYFIVSAGYFLHGSDSGTWRHLFFPCGCPRRVFCFFCVPDSLALSATALCVCVHLQPHARCLHVAIPWWTRVNVLWARCGLACWADLEAASPSPSPAPSPSP